MGIPSYLPRSRESDLTDEELVILEAFVDDARPVNYATNGSFGCMLNLPYEHGLPDEEVERIVRRWLEDDGLLEVGTPNDEFWSREVRVTAEGGARWEAERRPDWDLFLSTDDPEDWRRKALVLMSASAEICTDAYETFRKYGSFLDLEPADEPAPVDARTAFHWKDLGPGFRLDAEYDDIGFRGPEWLQYFQVRYWWSDVRDLIDLWKEGLIV